jgi:hypothetical protein
MSAIRSASYTAANVLLCLLSLGSRRKHGKEGQKMKLDEHMVKFKEEIYETEMQFTDLKKKSRNYRSDGAIQHCTIIRLRHLCPTLPYTTLHYPILHYTCINPFI